MVDLCWPQLLFCTISPVPSIHLSIKYLSTLDSSDDPDSSTHQVRELQRFMIPWEKKIPDTSVLDDESVILEICPLIWDSPRETFQHPSCQARLGIYCICLNNIWSYNIWKIMDNIFIPPNLLPRRGRQVTKIKFWSVFWTWEILLICCRFPPCFHI